MGGQLVYDCKRCEMSLDEKLAVESSETCLSCFRQIMNELYDKHAWHIILAFIVVIYSLVAFGSSETLIRPIDEGSTPKAQIDTLANVLLFFEYVFVAMAWFLVIKLSGIVAIYGYVSLRLRYDDGTKPKDE